MERLVLCLVRKGFRLGRYRWNGRWRRWRHWRWLCGSSLAAGAAASYYEIKDTQQEGRYEEFLYAHYGVH